MGVLLLGIIYIFVLILGWMIWCWSRGLEFDEVFMRDDEIWDVCFDRVYEKGFFRGLVLGFGVVKIILGWNFIFVFCFYLVLG